MGSINKKVQRKFEKVFKNVPKDIPLQYELGTILKLMQEMYDMGFSDGYEYAEGRRIYK